MTPLCCADTPSSIVDPEALCQAVPAPGVHPRILFGQGDIPMLKRRLEQSKTGQNDTLVFSASDCAAATRVSVLRDGAEILSSRT